VGWSVIGDVETCVVPTAHFTSEDLDIFSVDESNDSKDLTGLSFTGVTVNYLPRGLGTIFVNLLGLEIKNSKLKSIKRSDLSQFRNLKELWLHGNNLKTLPGDLFQSNEMLQEIYLLNNNFHSIGTNLLTPLKRLKVANFDAGSCISVVAKGTDEIRKLSLQLEELCPEMTQIGHLKAKIIELEVQYQVKCQCSL
jgi:hypothetical protein